MKARNEVSLVLQSAGFLFRKWTGNCDEVLREYLLKRHLLEFEDTSTMKALSILWNERDTKVFLWTDSVIVLAWIHKLPCTVGPCRTSDSKKSGEGLKSKLATRKLEN